MSIIFEKFTEKHIDAAVMLALRELEAEKKYCQDLPDGNFAENLRGVLYWLSGQPYGKAAVCDGTLVGYLLFGGPWDGFFGNVKGVFSPLGGSAFSYDYENRGRLASRLFERAAEDFVQNGVYSCAVSRYAHDEEIVSSFVLNGFGIRCCDAVRQLADLECSDNADDILYTELSREEFKLLEHLQRGLHRHLEKSPVFFWNDRNDFENWFENWTKRETMRIFAAKSDNEIIGFISIDDAGENFLTEHGGMKNICGAFFEEKYRGRGIPQALLAYIRNRLKAEGATHLGVDCETLNPTALNFWGKYFVPYTYSFARRIDERIGS